MRTIVTAVLAAGLLFGCSMSSNATLPSEFDSAGLNAVWYGSYTRPIASVDGSRQQQDSERASPSDARRSPSSQPEPSPAPARGPASTPDDDAAALAAAYVQAVYELNDTPVHDAEGAASVVDIYRHAQSEGTVYHTARPSVGDLVFFHNTYDRNGDGRNNDWYSHIGIVEAVDSNGTVHFLSYIDGAVQSRRLHPEEPESETMNGDRINDRLRERNSRDPEHTQYLAGELFAGFGALLGDLEEVLVLDDWTPGAGTDLQASH